MPANILRKGQTQLLETILVMIFLVVILVVVLSVAGSLTQSGDSAQTRQETQDYAYTLTRTLSSTPTLNCPQTLNTDTACINTARIEALKTLIESDADLEERYFQTYGDANLSFKTLHPQQNNWTLYASTPQEFDRALTVSHPVLLHNPHLSTTSFGVLEVTTYR